MREGMAAERGCHRQKMCWGNDGRPKGEPKLTLFEEETDLIAALQEIVVAHVLHAFTLSSRETGHGVVLDGKVLKQAVRLCKEIGYSLGVKGVGNDEVAIAVEGFNLGGRKAWSGGHDNGGWGLMFGFYAVGLVSIRTCIWTWGSVYNSYQLRIQ